MKYKIYLLLIISCLSIDLNAQQKDVVIKIHLKGVYQTDISLIPTVGDNALRPIIEKKDIKFSEVCEIVIPNDRLPGQFVLRFDYKEKEDSSPYPAEKYFFINKQDLELWVHPLNINNPDSTYFQKDEIENSLFDSFMKMNIKKKKNLGSLRNFLIEYDSPKSEFYKIGVDEYENRRQEYNLWIKEQYLTHKSRFVSNLFGFQYVTPVLWEGTEEDRVQSMIDYYFDGIDMHDPLLIKTADMRKWMDNYVNIYGAKATSVSLRDSLFTLAGSRAIEKAKQGNPLVYGWMVDYFYRGFESFNISKGMSMLERYIEDPNCLTKKKLEIQKRLDGMKTLLVGRIAPDFIINHNEGKEESFLNTTTKTKYKLVLFWSADCMHCKEDIKELYSWYNKGVNNKLLDVYALSVDESDTEIALWNKAIKSLHAWNHIRVEGGINSNEANSYFVLSVPLMVLVDSKSNEIVAFPQNVNQLKEFLNN